MISSLLLIGESQLSAEEKTSKPALTEIQKAYRIKLGKRKAQLCTRCHGGLGLVQAAKKDDPNQTVEAFIIRELVRFRDGQRLHKIMNPVAKTLKDEDISQIASWFQDLSKRNIK